MSVQVGQEAPDFTLKNTDMQDVSLSAFRGQKNVVLLFVPFAFDKHPEYFQPLKDFSYMYWLWSAPENAGD